MKRRLFVAIAGVPEQLQESFAGKSSGKFEIIAFEALDRTHPYSPEYCERIYKRLSHKLRTHEELLVDVKHTRVDVILLYVQKGDESDSILYNKFATEVLLMPMASGGIIDVSLNTHNQVNRATNALYERARKATKRADALLAVIGEEIHSKTNTTCLLLPRRNFGKKFDEVLNCVHYASRTGQGCCEFRSCIRALSRILPKKRKNNRNHYFGDRKLVYEAPRYSRELHGFARWNGNDHELNCIIRGRLRFGTAYNPRFHYDCELSRNQSRKLPNCHGTKTIGPQRTHVNIAPNDNVR